MSTELKPRSKSYFLTQFAGKVREDGGDCRKIQVTGSSSFRAPFFCLAKDEVIPFVKGICESVDKATDAEDTITLHGIELSLIAAVRLGWDLVDWLEDKLEPMDY